MTSFKQALHVMAKDLRESRIALGAYLLITLLATATAVKPEWVSGSDGAPVYVLLLELLGMVVVASFVQGDSPTRTDAFWASRPFNPSAVLAAKVILTSVIVLAVPVMGELAALLVRHVDADVLAGAVAATAWQYTTWLMLAFVVAAMTRDLKTFLITIATIPVLFLALTVWSMLTTHSTATGAAFRTTTQYATAWSLIVAGVLLWAGLLAYLYRTRDARPRTWVAGLVCVFLLEQTPGQVQPRVEVTDTAPSVPRTTFTVNVNPYTGSMNGVARYSVQLTPDSVPRLQRLTLISGTTLVQGRSGATLRQPLDQSRIDMPFIVHALTDVTWVGEPGTQVKSVGGGLAETDGLRGIVASGIADLVMDGRVLVRVPGTTDTLELRAGSTITRRGTIMSISKWGFYEGQAKLEFAVSSVPANFEGMNPFSPGNEVAEFALVNESRHEAVALEARGGGSSGGWLVLPGVQVSAGHLSFENKARSSRPASADAAISDDWFRGARLVISHWVPVGSYPIHSENSSPSQPLPPPPRP